MLLIPFRAVSMSWAFASCSEPLSGFKDMVQEQKTLDTPSACVNVRAFALKK